MAIIDKIHSLISGSSSEYVLKDNSGTQSSHKHTKEQITDFPAIPAPANNGTLTIQKNGTNVAQFGADSASDVTANISVPTALSELSTDTTHRVVTDIEKSTWNNKAPTNHASTATTYGVGDATNYGHVKVDSALSSTSTNPVQNKAVKAELDGKAGLADDNKFTGENWFENITRFSTSSGIGHLIRVFPTVSIDTHYSTWPEEYKDGNHFREWALRFPAGANFWGKIRITLGTSFFSYNASGVMQKSINASFNSSTIYNNGGYYNDLGIHTEEEFRISELVWNSSENCWEIRFHSIKPTSNNSLYFVIVEFFTWNSTYAGLIDDIYFAGNAAYITTDTSYTKGGGGSVSWATKPVFQTPYGNEVFDFSKTLPIANGGTGATSARSAEYNILNQVEDLDTTLDDDRKIALCNLTKSSSNGVFRWIKLSKVWAWISTHLGSLATKDNVSDGDINGTISDAHIASASTWNGKYTKPSGGIPKSDLASAVQTSLGLADSALQSHQSLEGYVNATNSTEDTTALSGSTKIVVGKSGKNLIWRTLQNVYNWIVSTLGIDTASGSTSKVLSKKGTWVDMTAAANNGTLTIKRNGTQVATFSANQSGSSTADISVPTALSELSEDATHRVVTDTEKSTWDGKANSNGSNASGTWPISVTGNAATAAKLSTARNLKVSLSSTSSQSFDGSGNAESIGVSGTLPVANGGTGNTIGKSKYTQYLEGNGRISSANLAHMYDNNNVHVRLDASTSSMTTGKPRDDGYILTFTWDNSGTYDQQIFIPTPDKSSQNWQIRGCTNSVWSEWGDLKFTPSAHSHGNIQNGGTLQSSDITIASGDKLVVTDSSDSNKIARTSISFDGSTTTQGLSKKGTWQTFLTSHQTVTLATGTNNGTLKITVNGTATDNIAVKGLGSLAYKSSLTASDIPSLSADKITSGTLSVSTTGNAATATTAKKIDGSSNLIGDFGTNSSYYLVGSYSYTCNKGDGGYSAWRNMADVFSISSRHNGAGILVVNFGIDKTITGTPVYSDMKGHIAYYGSPNYENSRLSNVFYLYCKGTQTSSTQYKWDVYLITKGGDATCARVCSKLAAASNGTLTLNSTPTDIGTSVPSTYGSLIATQQTNCAVQVSAYNSTSQLYLTGVTSQSGGATIYSNAKLYTAADALTLNGASDKDVMFVVKQAGTTKLSLCAGSGNVNHGVYDDWSGKWMIKTVSNTGGKNNVVCIGDESDTQVRLGKYILDFSGTLGTTSDTIYFT